MSLLMYNTWMNKKRKAVNNSDVFVYQVDKKSIVLASIMHKLKSSERREPQWRKWGR